MSEIKLQKRLLCPKTPQEIEDGIYNYYMSQFRAFWKSFFTLQMTALIYLHQFKMQYDDVIVGKAIRRYHVQVETTRKEREKKEKEREKAIS